MHMCTYIHTHHHHHQTQQESKGIASCINFLRYPLLRDEPRAGSYRSQRSRLGTRAGSKLEGGLLGNGATQRFLLFFFFFSSFVLHLLCRPPSTLCWAIKSGSSTYQTVLLRCISGCRFLLWLVSPKGCFTRVWKKMFFPCFLEPPLRQGWKPGT